MRKFVVPALAAITLSGAFVAPAAMAETVTVKVSHADLDLTTAAGKKTLETRLAAAIKTACAKPDNRSLKTVQYYESCKEAAEAAAAEKLERTIQVASL